MTIKVSELFLSIQGEGRYVGVPSVFLRTFGCNFTCQGFNRGKAGITVSDVVSIVEQSPEKYKAIKDLPVTEIGCDSYISWHPKFKSFSKDFDLEDLAGDIMLTKQGHDWSDSMHLVITGGEPLLGWQKQYPDLFEELLLREPIHSVTFETNGTQKLSKELSSYLKLAPFFTHASVSPKLESSGEPFEKACNPDAVRSLSEVLDIVDLKFVIQGESDADQVKRFLEAYDSAGVDISRIYLMPEGATKDSYLSNSKMVAEMAVKYGVCYSPRLQVDLFKNDWGT